MLSCYQLGYALGLQKGASLDREIMKEQLRTLEPEWTTLQQAMSRSGRSKPDVSPGREGPMFRKELSIRTPKMPEKFIKSPRRVYERKRLRMIRQRKLPKPLLSA